MTPHVLLLTSANGNKLLIPIHAIESIEADTDGTGCTIYTPNGANYLVDESLDKIVAALGDLVTDVTEGWSLR